MSGGLAVTVPTAQNTRVFFGQGDTSPALLIQDQSVHLMPFLGGLWTPNDRSFGIGYVQVDVDASGDQVTDLEFFDARQAAAGRPLI